MLNTSEKDIYTTFYLGYAGSAKIIFDSDGYYISNSSINEENGTLFSLTNAVYTRQLNIPKVTSFYVPYDNISDAKSEIRLGFGTYNYTGSINFELTDGVLDAIWNDMFFKRKGLFHLVLNDGMNKLRIANCVWSSIQISAQPHSPISVSISFVSNNGRTDNELFVENVQSDNNAVTFQEDDDLVRYWETGVTELGTLESFNLNFSRNVTPIYLNNSLYTPSYLKPGRIDVTASLTCLDYYGDQKFEYDSDNGVRIYVSQYKYVQFAKTIFNSQTYNISGLSQVGTKVYDISSLNETITEKIFTIGTDSSGITGGNTNE